MQVPDQQSIPLLPTQTRRIRGQISKTLACFLLEFRQTMQQRLSGRSARTRNAARRDDMGDLPPHDDVQIEAAETMLKRRLEMEEGEAMMRETRQRLLHCLLLRSMGKKGTDKDERPGEQQRWPLTKMVEAL